MKHWIKEGFSAAMVIRSIRKSGEIAKLALVQEDEIMDNRSWLAQRDYENQLMQQCIAGMIEGRSPCWWCEEERECKRDQHMKKGCREWWLRFLTDEEKRKCEARAATPGRVKKQEPDGAGITLADVEKDGE